VKSARIAATLAAGGLLALPAAAGAHVTVQPESAPAGAELRLDVRVPNERDVNTTKVQLQLPDGFAEAAFQPVPGWKVKVTKAKLAQPIKTDDGLVTEEVKQITWSGGSMPPEAFQDFGLSVLVPDKPGTLTFKALQTYADGQVVRWIGPAGSDDPAPTVKVTSGASGDAAPAATPAPAAPAATPAPASSSSDDGTDTLSIVALVVGALGLLAGGLALAGSRARPGARV
jgi:uncharacterized protein YcnI